jgi:RimJ/RimL family protein N-acetyltransferase
MSEAIEPCELHTERLVLRQFRESDLDRLCELAGAREVYETTLNIPHPYTREDGAAWVELSRSMWADGSGAQFATALRETGELIGGIGLTIRRRHDRAELGFWLGVPYWGRGYTTEAARAVIDYGFGELGLERIWAGHMAGNEASGRVQQKAGLTREGVLRRQMKKDGAYYDDVVYAITRGDWERKAAHAGPPPIETERLVLRALRPDDVDALMAINGDERVAAGVLSVAHPYTRRDAIAALTRMLGSNASGEASTWLITLDGTAVGVCGFDVNERHLGGMIGYTIHADHWGRGLATEAVRAMIDHAFGTREPPMHRLCADHFPENPASGRVCEKAGMVREGVLRGSIRKGEELKDAVRWAIVRDDWQKGKD